MRTSLETRGARSSGTGSRLVLTSSLRVVVVVLLVTAEVVLYSERGRLESWGMQTAFLAACLSAAACTLVVALSTVSGLWSGGAILFVITVLFHLGLPITTLMGAAVPDRYVEYLPLWFAIGPETIKATWLTTIALIALTIGYVITSNRTSRSTTQAEVDLVDDPFVELPTDRSSRALGVGGLVIMLVGVALFLGFIALTAPSLLTGGDGKRLYEATVAGSLPIAYGTILVSIGAVVAAAAPASRARNASFAVLALFTALTLAFGSRTASLYSLVSVIVIAVRAGYRPRQRTALVALAAGLIIVSTVQQVRDDGIANAQIENFIGSPASAAAEMGLTLRPLIETVVWVDNGEPLRHGRPTSLGWTVLLAR